MKLGLRRLLRGVKWGIACGYALVACSAYRPNPATFVTETAQLPHMCGYGVSPHGTKGNGCWEGYECIRDACEPVGPHWGGPGTGSVGPLP